MLVEYVNGFRRSPAFRSFLEAVGPFIRDMEEMRHYAVTLSGTGGSRP